MCVCVGVCVCVCVKLCVRAKTIIKKVRNVMETRRTKIDRQADRRRNAHKTKRQANRRMRG